MRHGAQRSLRATGITRVAARVFDAARAVAPLRIAQLCQRTRIRVIAGGGAAGPLHRGPRRRVLARLGPGYSYARLQRMASTAPVSVAPALVECCGEMTCVVLVAVNLCVRNSVARRLSVSVRLMSRLGRRATTAAVGYPSNLASCKLLRVLSCLKEARVRSPRAQMLLHRLCIASARGLRSILRTHRHWLGIVLASAGLESHTEVAQRTGCGSPYSD